MSGESPIDLAEGVRHLVDTWNRRDIDLMVSLYASNTVLDLSSTGMGSREGRAAVRGHFEEWLGAYEESEIEAEEIRDLGNDVVFSVVVERGRPRGSTGWVRFRYAAVSTFVDGLVERQTNYTDLDEARADAERLAAERRQAVSEERTTPDPRDVIGRCFEALSHRDYDGALAPFSPHAVFDMSPAGAEVLKGRDSIRSFFEDWVGPYADFGQQLEEFHDLGNGVTLSVVAQRGRLPGSSSFLFVVGGHVGVWRDGLVERNTVYADIDEARAAGERLAEERG